MKNAHMSLKEDLKAEDSYRIGQCCYICKHVNWTYEEIAEEPCEVLNKLVFRGCVCDKFSSHSEEYLKEYILPAYDYETR